MLEKSRQSAWRPILGRELKESAADAVRAIATDLLSLHPVECRTGLYQKAEDPSLAGGKAGIALFQAHLAQILSKEDNEQMAIELLGQAIDSVATVPISPSLYSGFTGVAWTIEHLQGLLFDADDEDPNESIDDELKDYLNRSPWNGDYDLINGLVGFGVYALERLPRPSASECLGRIIYRLDEIARHLPEGTTWFTPPELLPSNQAELFPQGYYNLGVAHGVPGVIALLGETCAAGIAVDKARPLLNSAIDWLLAQKLPDDNLWFAPSVLPGTEPVPSRLAWCYGDLGVAAALMNAARSVNEPEWEREAIEIAIHASQCPLDKASINDAGLCHGAAGVGHIFNRMYQATGETNFREAAQLWFKRALEMRRPGEGVGGFYALLPMGDNKFDWIDDPGFLTGASGIGLALLAAITSVESAWDRVLLVTIPPRHF
jgi:lantibiotic biosynthesis protein